MMNDGGQKNQDVIDWAARNLVERVEIRPITQNRIIMGLAYGGLFLVPGLFILIGVITWITGAGERDKTPQSALLCGFVLLIPFGLIALLGYLVRRKFAGYLDAEGVHSRSGVFLWKDLKYVHHVTKFVDRGAYVSDRKIEDNNLDLVFEMGTMTIPPLIKNKDKIWRLIHSIPCEHRSD